MAYVPPGCDPAELLARLFAATWSDEPFDLIVRVWLQRGILEAVRRGEPLDQALGLAGPGLESLRRRYLREQRNKHLARAQDAVALDSSVTAWARCGRLAPLVRSFVADTWPKAKRLQDPPADWPSWKRHTFRAAQTGHELPTTQRGLHKAVNETPAFSVRCGTEMIVLSDFL